MNYEPIHIEDAYRHVFNIGCGGFSVVSLVESKIPCNEDQAPDRRACKTLWISQEGTPLAHGHSRLSDIFEETRLMRLVEHPNVLGLREIFIEEKRVHVVTELMYGGDLLARLARDGRIPEDDARRAMCDILGAVSHMHSHRVAHRDLKLENILIVDPACASRVKIGDFGLARELPDGGHFTKICGTPMYLAPEVVTPIGLSPDGKHMSCYGLPCDLWSCGVTLYMMLSGGPPFYSESLPDLMLRIRTGGVSFSGSVWSSISADAKDLICRLLTVDPEERITADEALCHTWIAGT